MRRAAGQLFVGGTALYILHEYYGHLEPWIGPFWEKAFRTEGSRGSKLAMLKFGLVPFRGDKPSLPVEVWLGEDFDLTGSFVDKAIGGMGFDGVEVGPLTYNKRIDKKYIGKGETHPTGALAGLISHQKPHVEAGNHRRVSICLEPSFGVMTLLPEMVEADLRHGSKEVTPFVEQITLSTSRLHEDNQNPTLTHFLSPTGLSALASACVMGRDDSFAGQLYYHKEKELFSRGLSQGALFANPEEFQGLPLSIPSLFVKIDKRVGFESVLALAETGIDGVVYQSENVHEAHNFLNKIALSKARRLEVQIEVPEVSKAEMESLAKAGVRRIQIPGKEVFEQGPYLLKKIALNKPVERTKSEKSRPN